MSILSSILSAIKNVFAPGLTSDIEDDEDLALQQLKSEFKSKIDEVQPFAIKADESYLSLIYNKLESVPAVELYDGNYIDRLSELSDEIDSVSSIEELSSFQPSLNQIATEIQTYLNEPTSELERAKLWDAKFIKGIVEHLHKNTIPDDTLSEVMRAFRNFCSFAQALVTTFGSTRLINATYEAVIEGKDAEAYMGELLDLDQKYGWWGKEFEKTSVPYAGFFGSGFFL